MIRALTWTSLLCIGAIVLIIVIDAFHVKKCVARPAPGTVIQVPGERMEIIQLGDRAAEDPLILDVTRAPFSDPDYDLSPSDGHIHPNQEERFEVVSGEARFLIGDDYFDLSPGEVGIVPPNTLHNWMALNREPVRVKTIFSPSLDVASWFVHFQKHIANEDMDFLQAAVISREYTRGSPVPANPHPYVWNLIARVLAPIGRLLGYKAC